MALYPRAEGGYWEYDREGFPIVGGYDTDAIEDFESGTISGYGGRLSNFRVQGSDVLQGRYSLESLDPQVTIGNNGSSYPTPRTDDPTEYKIRLVLQDDGDASIMTNVQSTSYPWRDCYAFMADATGNEIRLLAREGNSTRYLERKSVPGGVSTNTEYRPAINVTSEGIKGRLYDRNDSLIIETDSYRDTAHSGGGLGWHNGDGATTFYDYATADSGAVDNVSRVVLNGFEDGNLSEYRVVGGGSSGDQMATPSAAYSGNYGLEMIDYGAIQTTPGMGAPNYLRDGHSIEFRINFQEIGNEQYAFHFGMPDADSTEYSYKLDFIMPGTFRLQGNTGDGDFTLSGDSSEGPGTAACFNLPDYTAGEWYRVYLSVDSSEGVVADIYNPGGSQRAWLWSGNTSLIDSTMGFGHYCSGGGHYYLDEIVEN